MREVLRELYERNPNQSHLWVASVDRYAWGKSSLGLTQLLLTELMHVEGARAEAAAPLRFVCQHLWVDRPRPFLRLGVAPGDLVLFKARVAPYQRSAIKMLDRDGETTYQRPWDELCDFHLVGFKNVTVKTPKKPDCPVF